ncbi:hypothetical protein H7J50_20335 [Mycobacterium intermedium]|nr:MULTISPECIES: hypothetical protein [Mycobacterium]MCV6966138.1 hypothetical protein [Mycobacterium intermedium]MCV6977915.1 hypothetical protein [Mycobacterium bourgelatii]
MRHLIRQFLNGTAELAPAPLGIGLAIELAQQLLTGPSYQTLVRGATLG